MAAKTALNAQNLETLGAVRLAELSIEISTGNAATKRRLRLELAGAQSPAELAKEVRRRLATIDRSRSFVDWQGIRSLADDLEAQRRAIVETVARTNPREALPNPPPMSGRGASSPIRRIVSDRLQSADCVEILHATAFDGQEADFKQSS